MGTQDPVIRVQELSKRFGDKVAVDRVSFDIDRSEVFGFLGPNGAGKTTTIKMLTTLLQPTSGRATILGHDLRTEGRKIRERIGVVQQQDSFDQGLNVETSLDIYGLIWDVPRPERKRRISELIDRLGMEEFRRKPTIDLSSGQRRRLQVAREFIHDMDLLFLDEPTVGLDPIVRRTLLDFFKERVRDGLTIFFTTHILEEAEYLCDRIAVINEGRIIDIDTPENLKRRFGSAKAVEFKLLQGSSAELAVLLSSSEGVTRLVQEPGTGTYRVTTARPESVIPEIYRHAERLGVTVSSIYISETTLEDAFINLFTENHGAGVASEGGPREHLPSARLPKSPREPGPGVSVLRTDLPAVLHLRPGLRAERDRPAVRHRQREVRQLLPVPRGWRGDPDRHQRRHERRHPALVRPEERDVRADPDGAVHPGPIHPEHHLRDSHHRRRGLPPRLRVRVPRGRRQFRVQPRRGAPDCLGSVLRDRLLRRVRHHPLRRPEIFGDVPSRLHVCVLYLPLYLVRVLPRELRAFRDPGREPREPPHVHDGHLPGGTV